MRGQRQRVCSFQRWLPAPPAMAGRRRIRGALSDEAVPDAIAASSRTGTACRVRLAMRGVYEVRGSPLSGERRFGERVLSIQLSVVSISGPPELTTEY